MVVIGNNSKHIVHHEIGAFPHKKYIVPPGKAQVPCVIWAFPWGKYIGP